LLDDVVEAFEEGIGADFVEPEKIKPGGRKWRFNMIFWGYFKEFWILAGKFRNYCLGI
jgi:hypothetical protein